MKLIALTPIDHDGASYAPGDEIDVRDKAQAEALVAGESALPAGKAAKAPPATDPDSA